MGGVSASVLDRINSLESELAALKQEVGLVKETHATTADYGLTRLSTASDVTNADSFALSAIEKNATQADTLANKIEKMPKTIKNNLTYNKMYDVNPDHYHEPWIVIKEHWNEFDDDSVCIRQISVGTQWIGIIYKNYENYGCAICFSYSKKIYLVTKNLEKWEVFETQKSTIEF